MVGVWHGMRRKMGPVPPRMARPNAKPSERMVLKFCAREPARCSPFSPNVMTWNRSVRIAQPTGCETPVTSCRSSPPRATCATSVDHCSSTQM
eukprot:1931600-Rhodomonas_salina.1